MPHDPELIRHILEHADRPAAERGTVEIPVPATHSPAAVARHVALMIEHKLLDGLASAAPGEPHRIRGLTDLGRDLHQALRDKRVRQKIKHAAVHLGEDATLHLLLDIAKGLL